MSSVLSYSSLFDQRVNDLITICNGDHELAIRLCNFIISLLPFDSFNTRTIEAYRTAIVDEQIKFLKFKCNEN